MRAHLSQSFVFESAHTLSRAVALGEFTASMRVHGHTYTAEVTVSGEVVDGMIALPKRRGMQASSLDLSHFRAALAKVRDQLDHRLLDDVPGLGRPTLENLCAFIGAAVAAAHLPLASVCVSRATGDRCRIDFGGKA